MIKLNVAFVTKMACWSGDWAEADPWLIPVDTQQDELPGCHWQLF